MDTRILDGAAVLAPIAAWFGLFGLARLATRPRTPQAAPPTPDLGPEAPAVVSLLVNHWEITEDAAESTLLDLAARKILEFRQPANDPRQTTIHIRQPHPTGLNAYEQRVFARVSGLAADGVVPLTALTFREPSAAQSWGKRLAAEVIAEARSTGLSRRRFGKGVLSMLGVAAAVAGVCVAGGVLVFLHHTHAHDTGRSVLGAGFFTFAALSAIAGKASGERDTPAGRDVASRWLGVRAWLRGHEAFGDEPPAAVGIWDRYLSYGAAVGATRVASAVIDLGMGNRKRVWSSYGGANGPSAWHRVRVHYPRFWPRYGKTAPGLLLRGAIFAVIGIALLRFWYRAIDGAFSLNPSRTSAVDSSIDLVKGLGLLTGFMVAIFGLYVIARTVIDLIVPAEISGEVIWTELWRSGQNNQPSVHYLAIDDASGDSTKAWAMPSPLLHQCHNSDIVTVHTRRWSRRVLDVAVVRRGGESALAGADTGLTGEDLISAAMGLPAQRTNSANAQMPGFLAGLVTPLTPIGPLVSVEEVTAVIGVPVTARPGRDTQGPTPVEITEYVGPDGKPALMVARSGGTIAKMAMRRQNRAEVVPGLGDEAFGGPGWLAARRGDEVVVLRLGEAALATPPAQFLGLAQACVSRLPAHVT